ncbi:MAG TPA: FAD-binding oxidoreductase [Candidatus Saccharimonadales bacterium]|nr:FAD-binding oxidoreductase [Candidatus Saccharimonadales bacterium]
MATTSTTPATLDLDHLRAEVDGQVIGPDDADYDAARSVFYGGHDARPAAIIRVAGDDDVARVVAIARDTGLELAVRSGGHSGAGHGTTDGGLILDLSAMQAIELDVEGRTVWAETGLTAAALSSAVAEHGLVIGFGDTGTVGIGGITTGGGIGYLVRKYGLTIDNVLAADVLTADGQRHRVDAQHEPDLFWAIRGGGGNFGVVTRFRFQLHEVPSVVGGMLVLPATADTIVGFLAAAEAAPEELSTIANVMPAPPMPFLPEALHGTPVILGLMAYAGDEAAGNAALAPFRALAEPLADFCKAMPYPELFPPDEGDYHPVAVARTFFVEAVDHATAQLILDRIEAHMASSDSQGAVAQLRVLGGASARVPDDATAYAHRSNRIMVNVASLFPAMDGAAPHEAWVESLTGDLRTGADRAYVNFLADDGPARIRAAYPGRTWDRLVELKRRYDPDNLFRRNQNIAP